MTLRKTANLLLAMACVIVFALPNVSWAQAVTRESEARVTGTISVDFKDEPLESALDYISKLVGVNCILDPGIEKTITLKLVDVPYETVLEEIANRTNLVVIKESENLIRLSSPPRINMTFQNADLKAAIDLLARQADVNVVVAEDVVGTVNLRLKNVPWKEALETVVKTAGYVTVMDETGIMRVISKAALIDQLTTKAFTLKYIQPPSVYRANIDTEFVVGEPEEPTGEVEEDFPLFRALKSTLSEYGKIDFDPDKNALIVTDIPTKIAEIESIIKQLDVEPLQVFIDVKFATTTNDDILDFGADWTEGGTITPRVQLTGLGDLGFALGSLKGTDAAGNPYNYGNTIAVLPTDNIPLSITNPLTNAFTTGNIGVLDFHQLRFMMNFLKTDQQTEITQAPKLFVLDNQTATIFVGQTIRFAETFADSSQQGTLEYGIREASNSPVDTGFQLLLTPHIIRESNQVILTIIPEYEFLSGPDPDGFQTFESANGTQIRLPQVTSNTVVTRMKLESGQTAVIGGLVQEREREITSRIPLLGDMPVLGWLFKNKRTEKVRENLLIFITVYIIDRGQETRAVVAEDIQKGREARFGKPLYLQQRVRRDLEEEMDRMRESRRAYKKHLGGSEFKEYSK